MSQVVVLIIVTFLQEKVNSRNVDVSNQGCVTPLSHGGMYNRLTGRQEGGSDLLSMVTYEHLTVYRTKDLLQQGETCRTLWLKLLLCHRVEDVVDGRKDIAS